MMCAAKTPSEFYSIRVDAPELDSLWNIDQSVARDLVSGLEKNISAIYGYVVRARVIVPAATRSHAVLLSW